MCGIYAYLSKNNITNISELREMANRCKHRGPDQTKYLQPSNKIFLTFHRLSINDKSELGMQPFLFGSKQIICNGEIYNFKNIRKKYKIQTVSESDTEVILPLVNQTGIKKTCELLDGVFAFVMTSNNNEAIVARDPFGVRSLYYGIYQGDIIISSELKCIPKHFYTKPFTPGTYSTFQLNKDGWSEVLNIRYYYYNYPITHYNPNLITNNIYNLLSLAVQKRLISDRPIGCLLSGGLDSSIITALLSLEFKKVGKKLRTFSIGLPNSEDLRYAKIVADYLQTEHTEVVVSEDEMLNEIANDIYYIESYDTTTIRASTPMYMLCKYIKNNTDIKVIFSGEGSDEASGSYMYFHQAPNVDEFQNESIRLLTDISYFDVLRADKSSAAVGLEIRVPFLDQEFINYYLKIDPKLKIPNGQIEKKLLRQTFSHLLPDEITWRVKEGMSDGVSSMKRSWYHIIQDSIKKNYKIDRGKYLLGHNPPKIDEAIYYRDIFCKLYPNKDTTIPYYWLPRWCGDINEPSGRIVSNINKDMKAV